MHASEEYIFSEADIMIMNEKARDYLITSHSHAHIPRVGFPSASVVGYSMLSVELIFLCRDILRYLFPLNKAQWMGLFQY